MIKANKGKADERHHTEVRRTGDCYYLAEYPGDVVMDKCYTYSEKPLVGIYFENHFTVEKIGYAVRLEKQRM